MDLLGLEVLIPFGVISCQVYIAPLLNSISLSIRQ